MSRQLRPWSTFVLGAGLACGIAASGLVVAQEIPDDEPLAEQARPTGPRHIILPDPFEGLEKKKAAERTPVKGPRAIQREPSVPPRITRSEPRPVRGDAPVDLFGRYKVVEVTVAGVTEDFTNKMERAGRALNEDCIVVRQIFDFGPAPEEGATGGYRPREVELVQIRECDVGGLGKYAEEVAMVLPARWTEGEGSVTLTLPSATMIADFVRVDVPRADKKMTAQWLAPESRVQRGNTSYAVISESGRRGELPVLHLTTSEQVYHLEADMADSSFDNAMRAMIEGQP